MQHELVAAGKPVGAIYVVWMTAEKLVGLIDTAAILDFENNGAFRWG